MYIASSSFIVQDMTGIQVFNDEGFFVSRVWRSHKPWECFGLAEDEQRRLWFIDFNWRSKETHLRCYDLKVGKPVKGISPKELVGDRSRESKCRFLTFSKGKLYITDLGLDQVYILDPNNLESFRKFGSSGAGDGQFNDPAGVVVDDVGNILVADSKNHRLCLFDKKRNWIKKFQVSQISLLAVCFIMNIAGSCETSQRHPAGQQQGRAVLSQHAGQGGCRQVRPHIT